MRRDQTGLGSVPGSPAAPRLADERRDDSFLDSPAMDPLYKPDGVEARWQKAWEDEGLYAAEPGSDRPTFVIAVPPPNVTGELHMGHALNASIQDLQIRYHRMRGYSTLWQPGYDHAGIATQNVVERDLAKEGLTRHDLGREAFVERTWRWLEHYGGVIVGQSRRLGASLDYRRERFTMDEGYVRAVLKCFVHLHDRGFLYRDNRIVNWCPRCASAISDLEVNHSDEDDTLYTIRYPLADGSGHLTIATVRPPTMLADVAVAVHPDDERYRHLVGQEAIVPVAERRVPIIADDRVDPEFGTGAVKITPGHDPMDFDIGRTHGLPELTVIGLDGLMNADAGELAGLAQAEAEKRIVAILRDRDLLESADPYRHSVGHCDRCDSRIEPLITLQWWCEMTELAAPAIEAVRDGRIRFRPERYAGVYLHWMESIRPWCVSRQLWWGHRIPVWYCADEHLTVAESEPEACGECGSTDLRQDEDVLDTWFSSQLWPFATLGWPDQTPELAAWYPNDVSSTDRGIIFLWEARMIMAGLELMGEIPFHTVNIHSTINAPDGRRMSKSLGTGIDPLEAIDEYGADATRYGLLKNSSTQDVRFSYGTIEEGRKLANKLWNVSRLILQNSTGITPDARPRDLEERWILARIDATRAEVEDLWNRFELAASDGRALPPHVRRLLRLVRRGDQAAAVRGRRGRSRDRARRARAAARAPAPGPAARDGGDLVAASGTRGATHRFGLARAGSALRRRRDGARARPGGGADLSPERCRGRARLRRRTTYLRGGRPTRAVAG